MKRLLAIALVAVATAAAPATAGPSLPKPGGTCEDPVDTVCRVRPCGPDELDCGMIPPCFVWVLGRCVA